MCADILQPDDYTQRKPRTDGVEARQHLLHTALKIFAQKGFADASVREIATAAGVNISAISYYFGDKAGLYRAAFTEPMGCLSQQSTPIDALELNLRQALTLYFNNFLEPLMQNEWVQYCTRLHFREMLEPTGLWADTIDKDIKPTHMALVSVICRELSIPLLQADNDIHRLALSIAGLAVYLFCGREVIDAIKPELMQTSATIIQWRERLIGYAEAMIMSEQQRRKETQNLIEKGEH